MRKPRQLTDALLAGAAALVAALAWGLALALIAG